MTQWVTDLLFYLLKPSFVFVFDEWHYYFNKLYFDSHSLPFSSETIKLPRILIMMYLLLHTTYNCVLLNYLLILKSQFCISLLLLF